MFGSFFSIIIFLASCVNYEKHALRVSRVIAVLAKSACKHAIFLATRVKKEPTSSRFFSKILMPAAGLEPAEPFTCPATLSLQLAWSQN